MWLWDSFNTGLGVISSLNFTNPTAAWVANITVGDWSRVWAKNMNSPTISTWNRTIDQYNIASGTQSQGGWELLVNNLVNNSVIDKSFACGDMLSSMQTNWFARRLEDSNLDGRVTDLSTNLGRDGTNIMVNGGDSADATYWYALDSASMAQLYTYCGNTTLANNATFYYNLSKNGYRDFWNSSANDGEGVYWNLKGQTKNQFYNNSAYGSFNITTDWAASPFAQGVPLLFNLSNTLSQYLVSTLLKKNFTDGSGTNASVIYTSIPYRHQCYSADGHDNACPNGNTWDGAAWAGVDVFWIGMSVRDAINRFGYANMSTDLEYIKNASLSMFGIDSNSTGDATPYGAESWDASNRATVSSQGWASNPYGWGGNVPTAFVNTYDIFAVLTTAMNSSAGGSGGGGGSSNCVNVSDDLLVDANVYYCPGTFYVTDLLNDGVLQVNSSNAVVNLTGVTLIGNGTGNSIGANGRAGFTIHGLTTSNYTRFIFNTANGVTFDGNFIGNMSNECIYSNSNNINVTNNVFSGWHTNNDCILFGSGSGFQVKYNTFSGYVGGNFEFQVALNAAGSNILVQYNNFTSADGVRISGNGSTIDNNNFVGDTAGLFGSTYVQSWYNNITNNKFRQAGSIRAGGNGAQNLLISGNNYYNESVVLQATNLGSLRNITIKNNVFNWTDTAIDVYSSTTIRIFNNTIDNTVTNSDIYDTAIRIEYGANDSIIENNTILNYGSVGIFLRGVNGSTIKNNTISQINISEALGRGIYNSFEPTAGIAVLEIYKGFTGDSTEQPLVDNLTNKFLNYRSDNINISGTIFNPSVQTFVRLEGASNVKISDLPPYWYRKVQMPTYLVDPDEYYNNLNTSQLVGVSGNAPYAISSNFLSIYGGSDNPTYVKFNWTMSQTNMTFRAADAFTPTVANMSVTIFNGSQLGTNDKVFQPANSTTISNAFTQYSLTFNPGLQYWIGNFSQVNDTTPPTLTVTSPQNITYNTSYVQITLSCSDDIACDDIWYNNGSMLYNFTYTIPVQVSLANNSYQFSFFANDTSGNVARVDRSFNISFTPALSVISRCSSAMNAVILALQIVFLLALIGIAYLLITQGMIEVTDPSSIVFWIIALIIGIVGFNVISSMIAALC